MIRIVVQPEVEINKKTDFVIYFDSLPDNGSIKIDTINGLELIREDSSGESVNESDNNGDYSFYTYATPTKLGEIIIPPVSIKIKGVEYKSQPYSFNVVDSITVDSNSVRTVLITDKNTYSLKDTIKLSLYEYSRFSNTHKVALTTDTTFNNYSGIKSITGGKGTLIVNTKWTLAEISGIQNLEEYLDEHFEITDFKWNLFNDNQSMEKLNNEIYIKTELFSIYLLANKKGEYIFQPSIFGYSVYKNEDNYFDGFVPEDDNSGYRNTNKGATRLKVISNSVKIKVQ